MSEKLTLRGVGVHTPAGRPLLAGIDLEVAPGELVALTGPSGCGKTTLLRAVAALIDPASGEVRLGDREPAELGWPVWRRRVTYVAQQPVMLDATVGDNLARPFSYHAVGGEPPEARTKERLERLGLGGPELLEQPARTLSVGEQQRVSLVRALAIEPDVLLLDEPTSALDERAARSAEELLRAFAGEGRGALAVTHDPAQAERFCDRRIDLERFMVEKAVA